MSLASLIMLPGICARPVTIASCWAAHRIIRPAQEQQLRNRKKTFLYERDFYGAKPIVLDDEYMEAEEDGTLESYEYKPIKFAPISATISPLFEPIHEQFCRNIMKGGRKSLAYQLMQETFYEIKTIQYNKRKKQRAKAAKEAAEKATTTTKKQNLNLDPSEEDESGEVETDPMKIFIQAIRNCEPVVITRKVQRGGAIYDVPFPIDAKQRQWYSIKWIINSVLERPKPRNKHFPEVLASELIDAFHERGKVVKRRNDNHKLADSNRAYAHYRWG